MLTSNKDHPCLLMESIWWLDLNLLSQRHVLQAPIIVPRMQLSDLFSLDLLCSSPSSTVVSRKYAPPPCIFSTKSCCGIFIPRICPPKEDLSSSRIKSLGCLPLKCLPRTHGPPASTMDMPATSRKCPAFLPLNAEAH